MKVEFMDMQDKSNPLNGTTIGSGQELASILDQLRHREPFGLELDGENGFSLTILLAETFGAVQYAATGSDPPYFLAVAPDSPPLPTSRKASPHFLAFKADEEKGVPSPEFLVGGTGTPMPTRYCLPYDLVKGIALYFLENGARNPNLVWESV